MNFKHLSVQQYSLFVLLLFCYNSLFAQTTEDLSTLSTQEVDSIRNELKIQGEYEAAIPYASEVVKRTKKEKHDSTSAVAIKNLGILYYAIGDYQAALPIFEKTKDAYLEAFGPEHDQYLRKLNNLAALLSDLGKYEEAEPLFLEIQHTTLKTVGPEHETYAKVLYNFARLYYYMEHYKAAESLFLQAKKIWANTLGTQHPNYGECLNGVASLYKDIEHYEAAEPLYLEALEIQLKASAGEKNTAYATCLVNLASLYKKKEEFAKAKVLYLEAIDIDKKEYGVHHPSYFPDLLDLADLYIATRQLDLAEPMYLQAQKIVEKALGTKHPDYGLVLDNLAFLYLEMERYDEAEKLLLQSKIIYHNSLGDHSPDYIQTLNELATVHFRNGNLEKSKEYAIQALVLNCPGIDTTNILNIEWIDELPEYYYVSEHQAFSSIEELYNYYMLQYERDGNSAHLTHASELAQAAMNIGTKIRHHMAAEGDQLRMLAFNIRFVQKGIVTALALDKAESNNQYSQMAFNFAEQNKSILLSEALKAQRARSFGNLPDSLALKEHEYHLQHAELKKMLLHPKDEEEQLHLRNLINNLNLEQDKFKQELEIKFPKYYKNKYSTDNIAAQQVQDLLEDNTMLLEYFISDTVVYLFAIAKEKTTLYSLPMGQKSLHRKIRIMRNSLSNYAFVSQQKTKAYDNYTHTAHWFWQELVSPALAKEDDIDKLIIITDGELGHLPFEAFLTKPAPQEVTDYSKLDYMLKKYQISYNYSATLWRDNMNTPPKKNNHEIFACAPSYEGKTTQNLQSRAGRALHLKELRNQLDDLPAAKKEVEKLAAIFKGTFLYGLDANEKAFKANASEYGVIHLAMHGLLNQQYPILSSLVFTEDGNDVDDNFLEAYEVSELTLNNDLVVLSACETGYGKFAQGEGVLSLARSFMYAGVPSVVVSLWQVNDQSTAIIMESFYQNLTNNMNKTEALQKAKLDYLNHSNGFVAHPAFWAPFVQIGNNQSIEVSTKGLGRNAWLWTALGASLVIIIGLRVIMKQRTV